MRSCELVDGESHHIGRLRRRAATILAAGGARIGHRHLKRARSRRVRVWNCGRQLSSAHAGGGQYGSVPIDGRIAVKVGAGDH